MLNFLWKEVEQLTLHKVDTTKQAAKSQSQFRFFSFSSQAEDSLLLDSSSVSSSSLVSFDDEIKQIISKQRQQRQKLSNQCLSQITSSITSSCTSAFSAPSWLSPLSTPSTSSSVAELARNRRRVSTTLCLDNLENTFHPMSSSPSRFNTNRFQYMNTINRIRSVSGYGINHYSSPQNRESFLHSGTSSYNGLSADNQSSVSLDKGLNSLHVDQVHVQSDKSMSSTSTNSDVQSSSSLLKMLDANNELNESEEICHESIMKIENSKPPNVWLQESSNE